MKSLFRLLIPIAVFTLFAVPSQAREYVVHTCKLPDGSAAPADGWTAQGSAPYMWFDNACARGGALTAGIAGSALSANHPAVGWGFDSGEAAIRGYRIVRSGALRGWSPSAGGASMLIYSSDSENTSITGRQIDYCAAYSGCNGVAGLLNRGASVIPAGSSHWFFSLVCGGNWGDRCTLMPGAGDFGQLRIDSASFTLDDSELPQADAVQGTLMQADATHGSVRFTGSDQTSGARRAIIEADGIEVAAAAPEAATPSCKEVGQSLLPDFTLRRPCPASAQFELTLTQGRLAPGEHNLRVRLFDAAGNAATVFGPRQVTVTHPPSGVVTASAAARLVPDRASALSANFGRRMRVSGVLLSREGVPIAGAQITAVVRSPAAVASRREITVSTDAAGRYRVPLRAISNRSIHLTHEASGAELTQRLTVRSRVLLRAASRRVRPYGRMRLTGRIQTEPVKRGASVAIKVRSGRRWRTVGVVRSTRRGHFRFSYRFRRTARASFVFRVVALRSGDLAVTPSPSNTVRVRVGR